ncbi:RNA-dependent RNA polymerase [Mycena venus]|uniref:RNA-dependent RNA polymerase n=1 Tax=Mycena venus TaxID=2733690 RepID=A0A8H6XVM1_9AGAR|nr:RNA-dependent RNA polymerase [Mycena venus]
MAREPNVRLEPLQMTRSHHLARELGSVSVIALRDDKNGDLVRQWARRKFILCGRTYIALPPKASKVYLIETNEDYGRLVQEWCGDQHRISYDEYIHKNNPMALNANQPFAKYLTRLNLYLSTSIPVLEFTQDNIQFIDDEYADGRSKDQRPPTETIMTDGCGFLNRAAALKISAKLKCERPPVAYQGRIAGSKVTPKGMWVLHPEDESPEPRIWIRDSQRKIKLSRLLRAHRIFDLLAVSKPSSSVHLSAQSIVILANNGVPAKTFCALQEQGLQDLITPLMDWDRPCATAYLWNAINDVSNVNRSRLQRLAAGASRALGFEKRRFEDVDVAEDPNDIDTDLQELPHTGRNSLSGEPLTVPEAAMDLLQAGFDPLNLPVLSFKIHNLIKSAMEAFLTKYRIPLVTSLEAYIIPDPSGELQEGEVFFKSSRDPDGPLQEQVVVGRYPMRESSDMQKVTAVDIPALTKYVDVLVISIHGSRSLASLLAGGGAFIPFYLTPPVTDLHEAIIIRDPTIVGPFQNRSFVPPPANFLSDNFERQVQTVTDFGNTLEKMSLAQAQQTFQKEVLVGLRDDKIGVYSLFHDAAVYEWGLDDARTRRIAHMTTTLLDASKTGLRLKKKVEETDQRLIGRIPRAKCFDAKKGQTRTRNPKLGPFVLETLLAAGTSTKDRLQAKFEKSVATHLAGDENPPDLDIQEPYHRATLATVGETPFAKAIASDLEALRSHVLQLRAQYDDFGRQFVRTKNDPQPPWEANQSRKRGPAKQTDNCMLPLMRDFLQPLQGIKYLHLVGNLEEIRASYAFSLGQRFGFSMAFRDICEIKRRAEMQRGPFNKVAVIDDAKNMGASARRLFKHMGD